MSHEDLDFMKEMGEMVAQHIIAYSIVPEYSNKK